MMLRLGLWIQNALNYRRTNVHVCEGYFLNMLHVQTEVCMHSSMEQNSFYSPWDFTVHMSLKSTPPITTTGGTKLISH